MKALLTLGDAHVDLDQARLHLDAFPLDVVVNYDLDGDRDGRPTPADGIALPDFGRLTFMFNRNGLTADDARTLLRTSDQADAEGLWDHVHHQARFEDVDLDDVELTSRPEFRLYKLFSGNKGIGPAKASKILHLKRPWLYPIIDSRFTGGPRSRGLYRSRARQAARESRVARAHGWRVFYWKAIQEDLIDNQDSLDTLLNELRERADGRELLGRLSPLRLQDIVAWSEASARQ